MTPAQLRSLVAVADCRGFTAAAEYLGVSQPAVSRAVAAIEQELETPMLARTRDGVVLTDAGEIAVARGREALRQLDLLQSDVAAALGRLTGTLRLASLPSATGTLMAANVRMFTSRHPHVSVRLFEGTDQEVRDWISQGAAEIGVITLPAEGFESVALGNDEFVVLLPRGHSLGGSARISFDALRDQDFILSTGGCGPLIMEAAHRAGVALRIVFEARDQGAILAMVAEGLGVSIVPTLGLPRDLEGVLLRPLEPRTCRMLALAHLADPGPAAKAFLEQVTMKGAVQIGVPESGS